MKDKDNEEKDKKENNPKKEEKKEPAFPEGYEYFDTLMANDLKRRQEIDKELAALGKSSSKPEKLTPKYTPPGFVTGRPSGNRDFYIEKLEGEKKQIEIDVNEMIEVQMHVLETDPETAAKIRETVMDKLHPNVFKDKNEKEMQRLGKLEKDLDTSQDYMRRQMEQFRKKSSKEEKEKPQASEKKPKEEPTDNTKNSLDASQEFMQKQLERFREQPQKEEKPVEEVKLPESKPMSMSERFSQSLHYTQAVEKTTEKSSPTKGKDEKSPDKD